MESPAKTDNPLEDIEEGEISDEAQVADEGESVNNNTNLPILQRKARLDGLALSRYCGRREDNPRIIEEGPGGNPWRREGLQYATSNGNYSPHLYNFAWAQAVQGKQTFPLENNNFNEENFKNCRGTSRLRDLRSEDPNPSKNGRTLYPRKQDDYISVSTSSSSSASASGSSSNDTSEGALPIKSRVQRIDNGNAQNVQEGLLGKGGIGSFSDDDEKIETGGIEDREEGELEEGEIEVGSGSLRSLTSSPERSESSENGRVRGKNESRASDRLSRHRDKLSAKNFDKFSIRAEARDRSTPIQSYSDDGTQRFKDQDRVKRLTDIGEMVKNVTVRDAQKSVFDVCQQLYKALECLNEMVYQMPEGGQDRPLESGNMISGHVKQIFDGIRAAYAVWNTASGKQQEQDKSAFPRLLEFANSEAQKLFTPKQIKELESMMPSISSGLRNWKADAVENSKSKHSTFEKQSSQEETCKPEGREPDPDHESLKTSGFNHRERISPETERTAETIFPKLVGSLKNNEITTKDSNALNPHGYAQASTSAETDSLASSNTSLAGCESTDMLSAGGGELSVMSRYKPWEEVPEEPNHSNLPSPTREASPADLRNPRNQENIKCCSSKAEPCSKQFDPLGIGGIQDEGNENALWPSMSEAMNAVTSYQEKFGGRTLCTSTRLPSPTPSEDYEEGEASYLEEVSTLIGNKESQKSAEKRKIRDTDIDNISFASALNSFPSLNSDVESHGLEPRIQNVSLTELELRPSWAKDNIGARDMEKSLNLNAGPSGKVKLKSRDPRRRGMQSEFHTVDLNKHPCQVDPNVITKEQILESLPDRKHRGDEDLLQESHYLKRQRNALDLPMFSGGVPVMTSGSGGWLEENAVIPSSGNGDQTSEMEIDSMEALTRTSETRNNSNRVTTRERELVPIETGNINKRQKTETFYQPNTSIDPTFEVTQGQPQSINVISNSMVQSPSMEEKDESKEVKITRIGQHTNTSVTLATNIIPTVLKDIAVNPTMLMRLINLEQQRLEPKAAQKPEQYQQTNPSLGPSSEFVPTSVKDIAVNPCMLTPPNLQQKHALQALATAIKPASQVAPMVGDSGKPRMKPRDPRRVLHINKNEVSANVNLKLNGTSSACTPVNANLKSNGTATSCAPVSRDIHMNPSRAVNTEITPRLSEGSCLPNIEQNFKEKLESIAEILGNSQRNPTLSAAMQNLSQVCVRQSNREAETVDMDREKVECSKFVNADNRGGVPVTKDPCTLISPSLQSLADANAVISGQDQPNPWGDVDHLLEGLSDHQRYAIQQERARRIEEQNKMFSARKLCLVLDLDHTLLNSAKFSEVDPVHEDMLRKKEEQDRDKPQRQLFRFSHMGMWTKLRPGIWKFLDRASKLYELHVYTMGNKVYATEMAKVLDPTGELFAGRVISKGDEADVDGDDRPPKSKDLDGVLGMESAVVIIDDSARVWPHHKPNLIVVERYMYFPCSRRQFGLPGPSLLEIDHDERPEDGTLASSLAVIEKIHHNFFSNKLLDKVDVRQFLQDEQRSILMGCRVVFSRVFPVGEAQPHLHPLWQMAEQFGAVCTTQIDEQVTHVVAISLGTDKVNWALATGRYVVHPGWLEASALLYRRANERDFSISM